VAIYEGGCECGFGGGGGEGYSGRGSDA